MMKFKNMLKCFSKTEVQDDKTHPCHLSQTILNRLFGRVLEKEGELGYYNNVECYPLPLREREELLCERSELSNSGEGCKDLPSPDATRHPLPGEGRFVIQNKETHPYPPLEREGVSISCAKRTEKNLFSYLPIHLFTFKKAAFTLAEVLITLAIIGVVAAMTLPTLIQNHQKRALEVATQKFYSTMSQAIRQYMADQGSDDLRNTPLVVDSDNFGNDEERAQKEVDEFFKKYLKAQICENGCFAKNYKTQKDEVSYAVGTEGQDLSGRYLLPDGMVVELYGMMGSTRFPGNIYVDVNGKKGPNKIGYDLWSMSVFYDGTLDEGGATPNCKKGIPDIDLFCNGNGYSSAHEVRQARFEWCLDSSPYGGCFGHFIENNFKFDY